MTWNTFCSVFVFRENCNPEQFILKMQITGKITNKGLLRYTLSLYSQYFNKDHKLHLARLMVLVYWRHKNEFVQVVTLQTLKNAKETML